VDCNNVLIHSLFGVIWLNTCIIPEIAASLRSIDKVDNHRILHKFIGGALLGVLIDFGESIGAGSVPLTTWLTGGDLRGG